jgi:transglutaminase-like putative cysteine protease
VPKPLIDARQQLAAKRKSEIEVRIKVDAAPKAPPALPVRDKKLAHYLTETPYEALTDERLIAASKKAVGDAKDAWTAARRINAFVYKHIQNKSLARAFSTATEALESREGDCTEHAVLFSALAKIAGIPTRLVTGLVYVGGPDGVFGYHEWDEVWVGDRWVMIDPTFGQDIADPTHLKFTEGLSDPDGLREAGIAAAELFGDMDLQVVEYTTTNGKRTRI